MTRRRRDWLLLWQWIGMQYMTDMFDFGGRTWPANQEQP